jgi:hypothetical protein
LGLAAVGVVSLASAARADEKVSQLNTALSNTTLSGYVDVGAQYNNATGAPYGTTGSGGDSLSLNVVDLALDKPLDATPFSAGYHIELWTGPGASPLGTGSIVRQAYLALGTTVGGQEIDWKIGVWDTLIGYEGLTSGNNPNYTHSYGFAIEPTTHTGIQGTYKLNDEISLQAGVADDSYAGPTATPNGAGGVSAFTPSGYTAAINGAAGTGGALHHPTVMGAVALTAPDSFGPMKGATLSIGGMNTANPNGGFADSVYVGATIPTPISALKFGGAFDYVDGNTFIGGGHIWVAGVYGSYQATDKLSFNVRGETYDQTVPILNEGVTGVSATATTPPSFVASQHGEEITATASYQLWANVLSRVEVRVDHADDAAVFAANTSGAGLERNALFLGAQLIYTF